VEGQPPFGLDDNAYALLHKVATGVVDPPQRAGPLTALLMRLLAADPEDRPTAAQARDALGAIAEGRTGADGAGSTAVLGAGSATAVDRTAVVGGAAGAQRAGGPVATTAAFPPAPPRGDAGDGPEPPSGPRSRRPLLLALLGLLVVGGGILAAALTIGGDSTGTSGPATTTSTAAPGVPVAPTTGARATTTSPSPTTDVTTTAPTTTSTTTTTTGETPTTASAVAFVQGYYGLLPGNTAAAWERLSPTARAQSGGRGGFQRFYDGMQAVSLENARSLGDGAVAGTVVFVQTNGVTTREPYRFVVGSSGGRPVIESFSRL
ncbi:MAG: serine/threonine protein kinase, partial [Pseudonocardia sp.]|nr:serine/threonine protein kinase [Pseudonocardia sp.]